MVMFEWVAEEILADDSHGDIVNVSHFDELSEASEFITDAMFNNLLSDKPKIRFDLGLKRLDHEGDVAYAYIKDGELPAVLRNACGGIVTHVPARYVKEFIKTTLWEDV